MAGGSSSISPAQNKRKKQDSDAEQDGPRESNRGQSQGTPTSSTKRLHPNQTPARNVSRNERSLSQPPPTSIIRKQLRGMEIHLDSQPPAPISSTPAANRPTSAFTSTMPTPASTHRNRNNIVGPTPRRTPGPGERSQLLTSEKKRRAEEDSALWTERKRRRSRFGGATPRNQSATGIGGWAGGRDESPIELLRRLTRGEFVGRVA